MCNSAHLIDTAKNNWIDLIKIDTINYIVVGEFETQY